MGWHRWELESQGICAQRAWSCPTRNGSLHELVYCGLVCVVLKSCQAVFCLTLYRRQRFGWMPSRIDVPLHRDEVNKCRSGLPVTSSCGTRCSHTVSEHALLPTHRRPVEDSREVFWRGLQ